MFLYYQLYILKYDCLFNTPYTVQGIPTQSFFLLLKTRELLDQAQFKKHIKKITAAKLIIVELKFIFQ